MISFILNDELINTNLPGGLTVLDFIRYQKHLTGTKIGCREGDCGACTVLVGRLKNNSIHYESMTSCLMPLQNAKGTHVVTIEGINNIDGSLTPVQQSMVDENGTQCGFCTPGFIVSLTGYCLQEGHDSLSDTIAAVDGNICRCTGYKSIERAAAHVHQLMQNIDGSSQPAFAISKNIVPAYFQSIPLRLTELNQTTQVINPTQRPMVNGGTDIYVQRPDDVMHTDITTFFTWPSLKEIILSDDRIEIGASVTVSELMQSPILQDSFPALHKYMKLVSSTPIRNMATVGGNIINASPIADLVIWFLAMDATVVLQNDSRREIPLRDFFTGYKKLARHEDEIIEKIYFSKPKGNTLFNFEKASKRKHLDIASVNTAIYLKMEGNKILEAHVSAGGVSAIPLYLKNLSSCLLHLTFPFDDHHWQELNFILQSEIKPITDVRGTADYKRLLLQQLFRAHFIELFDTP
ncbi:MAG: FAD binding domain-containing protein [Bacteroidota bacterium]|nr:FAD binding domain-containing protein [Bacteroidota bacterium]